MKPGGFLRGALRPSNDASSRGCLRGADRRLDDDHVEVRRRLARVLAAARLPGVVADDRLIEARRRCEFDFGAMLEALDGGDLPAAYDRCGDVERELKRLRREIKRVHTERTAD